jgi:putative flippase GtrA
MPGVRVPDAAPTGKLPMTHEPLPSGASGLRQGAGFLASGLLAFMVDAVVLKTLTAWGGMSPFLARVFAIAVAMTVGWLAHRRLTFAVSVPPSVPEFLRYAAVAWTAAAINYAVFAAILLVRSGTEPLIALAIASGLAMGVAYLGMRYGVFRNKS